MILIKRKSDDVGVFMFPDGTQFEVNDRGLHTLTFRAADVRPETHEALLDVPDPIASGLPWAGGMLKFAGGVWSISSPEAYAEFIEDQTIQARIDAKAALVKWVDNFLKPFTENYPETEVLTWPMQSNYSRAIDEGSATPHQIAFITGMAEDRGISLSEMVAGILAKAAPYEDAVRATSKIRSETFGLIDTASLSELKGVLDGAQVKAFTAAKAIGLIE